jgi:hypothetical protein
MAEKALTSISMLGEALNDKHLMMGLLTDLDATVKERNIKISQTELAKLRQMINELQANVLAEVVRQRILHHGGGPGPIAGGTIGS